MHWLCRALLLIASALAVDPASWIDRLGHDTYQYPPWVSEQQINCVCSEKLCVESGVRVDWRADVRADAAARSMSAQLGGGPVPLTPLRWCLARQWLLEHMPSFDLHFLPPSVTANGTSMLDDQIAFALMADAAAPWAHALPLGLRLAYGLPYAGYHESRQNWRPLLYGKFFSIVADALSIEEALGRLLAPNLFTEWSEHYWPSSPRQPEAQEGETQAEGAYAGWGAPGHSKYSLERSSDGAPVRSKYNLEWASSTAPPVVAPLDFAAYGAHQLSHACERTSPCLRAHMNMHAVMLAHTLTRVPTDSAHSLIHSCRGILTSLHGLPSSQTHEHAPAPRIHTPACLPTHSATSPPALTPGYSSCTGWATLLTYVARAVGIPARQVRPKRRTKQKSDSSPSVPFSTTCNPHSSTPKPYQRHSSPPTPTPCPMRALGPAQVGTPCWNSHTPAADFRGLAYANPNVRRCWDGGSDASGHGGAFLNNHNWVEVHDGSGAEPATRSATLPLPSPPFVLLRAPDR